MIGSKIHYNSIALAVLTALGLLVVFVAAGFIFSSGNPFAKAAMLVSGILFFIAAIQPRRMLVIMVPITFYLDEIKRLLVLTGKTGLDDVTAVLSIAPVTVVGIIVGCVIRRIFFRKRPEPVERLIFLSALAVFAASGGVETFTAGNLLDSLRWAANTTVYFLLPWALLECFHTREEIERFLKFCLAVGVPVALYGIWQYLFGLNRFEIEYMQSGLTMTGVHLYDLKTRPFSTLGSHHAYSNVMAFMLALSIHFASVDSGARRNWKAKLIVFAYAMALLLSMGRGAIFVGIGMVVFARLFQSKKGVFVAYFISAVSLGTMVAFAEKIQDLLGKLQSYLPGNSDWQVQAFRLGTFSDRLMGYQNVLGNPSSWPLFANPLKFRIANASYDDLEFSHDLFSQMILRIGAVPVFCGAGVAFYFLWRAHRAVLALPAGRGGLRPLAACLMAIIVVFLLSQAAGAGLTVFPMNFWTGVFAGLLAVICVLLRKAPAADAASTRTVVILPALTRAR